MNLYIDTNIFLTFYHLTNDDLDELEKLALLIESDRITLYLPEQTINEFNRNRDKSIHDAISSLKEQKISSRYPQISKTYTEYPLLLEAHKNFEKHKNKIITQIENDAREYKLNADILIKRIFESAKEIKITNSLVEKAKLRYDLGNPPGKGKSYGDAINWESLILDVDEDEDLCLVSDDSDFISLLNKKELNHYLKNEWETKKNSSIAFHKTLSRFFKDKFPEIKLLDELQKELIIKKLAEANSFSSAKARLAKLSNYSQFTNQQLNDIVETSISNNQLFWINRDYGIVNVLEKIISGNEEKIDDELMNEFNRIYRPNKFNIDDIELPF